MSECWCCGLGGITGTLCGHCQDAGCNRFTDFCEAAQQDSAPFFNRGEQA